MRLDDGHFANIREYSPVAGVAMTEDGGFFLAVVTARETGLPAGWYTCLVLIGVAVAGAVRVARRFALRRRLLDRPSERSLHQNPTPRLGGVAFVPIWMLGAIVLAWLSGALTLLPMAFFSGATVLYLVSLVDDLVSLPARFRFASHVVVAFGVIEAAIIAAPGMFQEGWAPVWLVAAVLAVWIVGLINAYNFMDGIDGLAGVQAVLAGLGWLWIGSAGSFPVVAIVGGCAAAAAAGFLTLNWPPARIFMGDAGSTVFGFTFAVLPLFAAAASRHGHKLAHFGAVAALVLWPFIADSGFTFLRRLKDGENVFAGHRSHLYQRLVMTGKSHRLVTILYGLLAAGGALLASATCFESLVTIAADSAILLVAFLVLWAWTRRSERAAHGVREWRR